MVYILQETGSIQKTKPARFKAHSLASKLSTDIQLFFPGH